jgi:hypothetical protein
MDFWGDEVNEKGMGFQLYSSYFYTIASNGGANRWSTGFSPAAGTWYFIAQTFQTNSVKTYVNGALVNTNSITLTQQTGLDFKVGRCSNGSFFSGYANGIVDDVRIYNRALSAAEIYELYEGGNTNQLSESF